MWCQIQMDTQPPRERKSRSAWLQIIQPEAAIFSWRARQTKSGLQQCETPREWPKDEDQTKPVARVLLYYFSAKERWTNICLDALGFMGGPRPSPWQQVPWTQCVCRLYVSSACRVESQSTIYCIGLKCLQSKTIGKLIKNHKMTVQILFLDKSFEAFGANM